MRLLLGTTNAGKTTEMRSALKDLVSEFLLPADLRIADEPTEDHETLHENALSKARFYRERADGLSVVAEDSGLYVDAISGELGVKTRRWGAGKGATDAEWLEFFLKRMEREENRNAKFQCAMVYIDADGGEHLFEGEFRGTITASLEHDYLPGLPVAGCFRPEGLDCVYAALSPDAKNAVSHRGRALKMLVEHLRQDLRAA